MHSTLTTLLDRLDGARGKGAEVLDWGCPVPAFGDISKSRVATVGINPSNREFVDEQGAELQGEARRFHTLNSFTLDSWADANARHLRLIVESCCGYFHRNPYDRWFKTLDLVVSGTNASYYDQISSACHLDLIPYATAQKWSELSKDKKATLLELNRDAIGLLVRDSPVRTLILNGRSVIAQFEAISRTRLEASEIPAWSLPRKNGYDVAGISYKGWATEIGGVELGRTILVLGFNHNLQSSYGVTAHVIRSIRDWVAESMRSVNGKATRQGPS